MDICTTVLLAEVPEEIEAMKLVATLEKPTWQGSVGNFLDLRAAFSSN